MKTRRQDDDKRIPIKYGKSELSFKTDSRYVKAVLKPNPVVRSLIGISLAIRFSLTARDVNSSTA